MIEGSFYIDKIIYKDYKSNFLIMATTMDGLSYTLLGDCQAIEGETIHAIAKEVNHPKFGLQYSIISYSKEIEADSETISQFILENIFNAYENKDSFNIDKMTENVNTLLSYNLNYALIEKICLKYKNSTSKKIKNNPYILLEDFDDFDFETVDKIAIKLGFDLMSNIRIEALILYCLSMSENYNGHVFIYFDELENMIENFLKIQIKNLKNILCNLQINKKIKVLEKEKTRIYLYENYETEKNLSLMLLERKQNINIITGGPGTGKTTMLKQIANDNIKNGKKVLLLAPTGRAAKRMYEATQIDAKTIHRALEFTSENGRHYFNKNDKNQLEYDIVIVDEMSMVDFKLMYHLILAIPIDSKILLVGDKDQLPSVGAGQVLDDLINSKLFNTTFLTKIHRQSENSYIVKYAHKINNKEDVDLNVQNTDFNFIKEYNANIIIEKILNVIKNSISNNLSYDVFNIQIICITKKGEIGTVNLNKILQNTLNPKNNKKTEIILYNQTYRLYDKVMQNKNNYDLFWEVKNDKGIIIEEGYGIFNGDVGIIIDINKENTEFTINFDGKIVIYNYEDIKDLNLAYAITVHKSQGSEYPITIFPIYKASPFLLYKNLLYTGLTRAKDKAYLIGDDKIFVRMEMNDNKNKRNTSLCE